MAYNNRIEEIKPETRAFIDQVFGTLEVIFQGNTLRQLSAPTIEVAISGKTYPFEFHEATHTIDVILCTEKKVIYEADFQPDDMIEVILEDRNTYWVSPFGTWREYFIRVQ